MYTCIYTYIYEVFYSLYDFFFCSCMFVCHSFLGAFRSLETGVAGSCEFLWRGWELNLGTLEKQPVFLIAESFLQPSELCSLTVIFYMIMRPLD